MERERTVELCAARSKKNYLPTTPVVIMGWAAAGRYQMRGYMPKRVNCDPHEVLEGGGGYAMLLLIEASFFFFIDTSRDQKK
jgi:hypothetical protein